jgi:predicted hotdog family 3-hydroxylacyl-ACP dehydratase
MIDHAAIASLIPHAGTMCLLDRVSSWDAQSIVCVASSHRSPGNPLALDGWLGVACSLEYAAQAMAVHGGLTGIVAERPRIGYLASARALTFHRRRLDDLESDLSIKAVRVAGQQALCAYDFLIESGDEMVAQGRVTVLLAAVER